MHAPGLSPFHPGGEFTLGAEEELQLVRADGAPSEPDGVVERVAAQQPTGTVSPEIFRGLIEFGTPVCTDAAELRECLASCRSALRAAGQAAIGVGVHPSAALGEFHTVHSRRYDPMQDELGGIMRTPTAALQVHVGVPDTATLIAGLRAVRNHLAVLRALAACSPFWHGRDSRLASTRGAIHRSYPRIGPPPAFHSYAHYESYAHQAIEAAGVPDYTYLWWDVRPHPRFGTLEVRVMDTQWSLDRVAALATLVQGIVRSAAERPPTVDLPAVVLDENDFHAVRFGMEARLVDLDGRFRPLREIAAGLIGQARAAMGADGRTEPLDWLLADLEGEPEPDRQRGVFAGQGMPGLLADLVARTVGTSAGEVRVDIGR